MHPTTKIVLVTFILCAIIVGAGAVYKFTRPVEQPVAVTTPTTTTHTPPPSPLLKHDIYLTSSSDPSNFPTGTLITKSGSVPDLLICNDGTTICSKGDMLIYFVDPLADRTQGSGISFIKSTDGGKTWSDRQQITVSGQANKGPVVDPSIVQLSDGRFRLYFFAPDAPMGDPAKDTGTHNVDSALSTDGVNFFVEGDVRFSKNNLTDPEVIQDGSTWLMYYSVGLQSGVATSTDGLNFTDKGLVTSVIGGVPGAIPLPDGSVRMYGCTQSGIMTGSASDGVSFENSPTSLALSVPKSCDPSVQLSDGTYFMAYKVVEE